MKVEIIGYDSGWGAKDHGTEDGPDSINMEQILKKLLHHKTDAKWRGTLGIKYIEKSRNIGNKEQSLPLVTEAIRRLAMHTKISTDKGFMPVVIGGDQSSSIGTWSGITSSMNAYEKFGLIFISSRFYAHTDKASSFRSNDIWWKFQSTPALLGEGLKDFTNICSKNNKIAPDHMVFIGSRDFTPEEEAFIKINNIKVFSMEDVKEKGFDKTLEEAIKIASTGTDGFGISFDISSFDPKFAPGVSEPSNDGLIPNDVISAIKSIGHNPSLKGLEITEFNPYKDENQKTSDLISNIITNSFAKQD